MVTRRDLRAERDFFSPMTGNTGTKIRYADAPRRKDTYGSEVKKRLADIKDVKSTRVNPIEAVFTKLIKTEDPFTEVDRKKSYAPEEEQDGIQEVLGGAAETAEQVVGDAVGEVREVVRSTGQRASERRAAQQLKRQQQRKADQAALDKRFTGVETGLSNLGKDYKAQEQRAIDNMAKFRAEQADKFKASDNRFRNFSIAQIKRDIDQDIAQRKTAQDAKAYEKNRLKQRELTQSRLKGIETGLSNLGKDYKAQEQRAIDNMAKFRAEQAAKFSGVDKRLGKTESGLSNLGKDYKAQEQRAIDNMAKFRAERDARSAAVDKRLGSTETGLSNLGKNYKAQEQAAIDNMNKFREGLRKDVDDKISEVKKMYGQGKLALGTTAPRQVVKGMTTGVKDGVKVEAKPKVAINASTFQQKNVRGSGIPNKSGKDESARKTVTIGGQTVAAKQSVASLPSNYKATEEKAFAEAAAFKAKQAKAKAASAAKAKAAAESKRAAAAAAKAKAEGKTKAQQAAAARKAAGPNRTMSAGQQTRAQAGPSARTAQGNRARVKSNARKRAQAAAKKRKANRGRNQRCDIRIKYNISKLTNMNLLRDDLANVAYFVKELQETI